MSSKKNKNKNKNHSNVDVNINSVTVAENTEINEALETSENIEDAKAEVIEEAEVRNEVIEEAQVGNEVIEEAQVGNEVIEETETNSLDGVKPAEEAKSEETKIAEEAKTLDESEAVDEEINDKVPETPKLETEKPETPKPEKTKAEKIQPEKPQPAKADKTQNAKKAPTVSKTSSEAKNQKESKEASAFHVSSNPHIRAKSTTSSIMLLVIIALLPTTGYGIYNFGYKAAIIVFTSIAASVLTEFVCNKIRKQKTTISDLSAVVTGLLLALNMPVNVSWWMVALGAIFAILVAKMLFGGIGQNFMNPALAGRCFLLISFPRAMSNFVTDVYTGATPLASLKAGEEVNILDMITGKTGGTIGETSMICILIGAVLLLVTGVIDLKIPASYILSFVVFVFIFSGHGWDPAYLAAQLSGGGLMLGAFFMATDYVTRPITKWGQIVYGIFLGVMTGVFRLFGPSAEGVSYAIIIGNLLVPLIEKITAPTPFGFSRSEFKKLKKGGKQ